MLLDGIRVIELANVISGPFAGLTLGDYGAEVIKIEMPGSGDPFRGWQDGTGAISPAFFAMNRGKKSLTLNLKDEIGRDILERLLADADVVIENFRPGVMTRLGLDYDRLCLRNPGLVYCSITGMGQTGPEMNRPTFDAIAQAYSGLWSQLTDMGAPEPVGPPMADQLSGQQAAMGIMAALVRRGITGQGCRVDASMVSASLAFQPLAVANYAMEGKVADRLSRAYNSQTFAFIDREGKPFAVHLSSPFKFWERLLAAVERPDLASDPRFSTRSQRIANYHVLHRELQYTFSAQSRDVWLARLKDEEVPTSAIHSIDEALSTDQVRAQGVIHKATQQGQAVEYVSLAASINGTVPRADVGRPAPALGEHTHEILGMLGIDEQTMQAYASAGTI